MHPIAVLAYAKCLKAPALQLFVHYAYSAVVFDLRTGTCTPKPYHIFQPAIVRQLSFPKNFEEACCVWQVEMLLLIDLFTPC
jgi:hypothetical protein